MSLAVVERIAVELLARLTAAISEGSINSVLRPTPDIDHTPEHLQVIVKQGGSARVPESDCPGNPPAVARRQTYHLNLHVLDSSLSDPFDTTINQFVADVIAAICTPQGSWHQFNGNSIDAEIGDHELMTPDSGTGASLQVDVTYRTDEDDITAVRA